MKRLLPILIPIMSLFLIGCATTQLSDLQRRSIEAKELEGTFENAYKATLQVLQDSGYAIVHSDYNAGVIKAEQGWHGSWPSGHPSKFEVSVLIEQWGTGVVKERITMMKRRSLDFGAESSLIVEDPKVIGVMYENIQKEMFVRKNLSK